MFGDFFRFAWRPDADGPFVLLRWHDCGIVMSRIGTYLNPRAVLGEGCSGVPRLERVRGASYLGGKFSARCLLIRLVRRSKPTLHFLVNVLPGRNLHAVRDAILLFVPAGVDQPLGRLAVTERKTEINPRVGGGLDLREDVPAIERHHGFAGARLHIPAQSEAQV